VLALCPWVISSPIVCGSMHRTLQSPQRRERNAVVNGAVQLTKKVMQLWISLFLYHRLAEDGLAKDDRLLTKCKYGSNQTVQRLDRCIRQ